MKVKIKKLHEAAIVPKLASAGAACFDLCAIVEPSQVIAEQGLSIPMISKYLGEDVAQAAHDAAAIYAGNSIVFRTGLQFEIPHGFAMLIYSRSGHGFNFETRLANGTGVIDSDYRGEVMVKLTREPSANTSKALLVKTGDRIAQAMIMPVPAVEFELADELTETERGAGGFGSTGK